MRADLSIMWVEDTSSWYSAQKDLLMMDIEDLGIEVEITRVSSINEFYEIAEKNSSGFSKYDIFFIDYALSDEKRQGNQLIVEIKKMELSTDILFYSSQNIRDIRKIVVSNIDKFEGIYLADRDKNFRDKSYQLIEKNVKRLSSIKNIRGFLMDQTSENDFIVKAYISKIVDNLSGDQKEKILKWLSEEVDKRANEAILRIDSYRKKKPCNLKQWLKLPNYMFPIQLQYNLLREILNNNEDDTFVDLTLENYLSKVVKNRNNLAHRKLVMCKQQLHLLHYTNINSFLDDNNNTDECCNHEGEEISIDDWVKLRGEVKKYGILFDELWDIVIKQLNIEKQR